MGKKKKLKSINELLAVMAENNVRLVKSMSLMQHRLTKLESSVNNLETLSSNK